MSIDWIGRSQYLTLDVRNFIDGQWKKGRCSEPFNKYSPRDGSLLYRFLAAQRNDVDEALTSARHAFKDGRWSKLSAQRRKLVLQKLAALIEQHGEELALLECLDVGKPIKDALDVDIPMAAALIKYNAEAVDKLFGKVYSNDHSSLSYDLHRPRGVIAAIIGWNFPLVLAAAKIGPALAMGNSLVIKPSELTSLSASRVAELALKAGVPKGVLNVIHGDATVGAALAHHREVDLVSFTGSSPTGKKLLVAAGESNMKRTILECGGKAPNIVFEDCPNLNAVADAIVARAFWNQGEVCTASSRLLVQESIKEELLRRVIQKTSELEIGDPLKPDTRFGALVSQGHRRKVLEYIATGEREGARVVHQSLSPPPFEEGFYISPVIFDQVSPDQKIAQHEIFGPVLVVISFSSEDEAINIANQTLYGLSAIVWTKDLGRAHRVTQRIDAGWVVVNATSKPVGGAGLGVLPIGGHKESGIGVEGGLEGLEAYTIRTAVQLFV